MCFVTRVLALLLNKFRLIQLRVLLENPHQSTSSHSQELQMKHQTYHPLLSSNCLQQECEVSQKTIATRISNPQVLDPNHQNFIYG